MTSEEKPEFAVPPPDDAGSAGAKGAIPDVIRKAVLAGMGALFLTEEGVRRLAREWKLPGEMIGYLGQQAQGAKEELLRVFSEELRRFLETEAVRREFLKALSTMVIEVKAEVRLRPDGEAAPEGEEPLRPEVRADVKARRAGRKPGRE